MVGWRGLSVRPRAGVVAALAVAGAGVWALARPHGGAVDVVFPTPSGPAVYRRTLTGARAVPVVTGARNQDLVEIISGLQAGDVVSRRELAAAGGVVRSIHLLAGAVALVAVALLGAGAIVDDGSAVPTVRVTRTGFTRTIQAEGVLRAVRATPITTVMDPEGPFRIAWGIADGSPVKAGNVVLRFDPTELERERSDGRDARRTADQRLAKASAAAEATIRNLERDASLAGEDLETARSFQSTDSEVYLRFEIVSSGIDATLAEKRRSHTEAVKDARQRLAQTDLELRALARRKAHLMTEKAEQGLGAIALVAPHDGIVVLERDWRGDPPRVGDTCWAGQKLAEIPDPTAMEAEISVLEADAGGLAVGQRATVTVEGRPEVVIAATVRQVDALAKPRRRQDPVQYFGAPWAPPGATSAPSL